ncbi:preprotein translocase subunit SecE [Candidatus Acetothermia bacterium]|nr:preprotein translocase subunit SecE [Candidatus Acetothermia bacterium]MBI3643836.1 preprotein translocase subunit SecE [Candidatus Acetothermia bacterium]
MEMSKVHWPSRLETTVLTMMVIAMLVVLTVIIWSYDLVFQFVVGTLLGLHTGT